MSLISSVVRVTWLGSIDRLVSALSINGGVYNFGALSVRPLFASSVFCQANSSTRYATLFSNISFQPQLLAGCTDRITRLSFGN